MSKGLRQNDAILGHCQVVEVETRIRRAVVFQKWRWPFLHRPSKGIAVDKQANHDVMHLRGFREADRLADQAFNTRPYGQMLPFDFLRVAFAWAVLVGVQMPAVGTPMIRVVAGQSKGLEQPG